MHAELALTMVVLLPLAGAIINGIFGRGVETADEKSAVGKLATGVVAAAFFAAAYCFYVLLQHEGEPIRAHLYDWFTLRLGSHTIPIGVTFVMDRLSGVMTLFVTGIGTLIHVYSTGYMSEDPSYARFFTYLNLFMASMLILVLGSSMPLLFVGWEGVGLCSYLLIGFWFENPNYAAAGKKAFIMNRIGDFGVIVGMFILMMATGSLEFSGINAAAQSGALKGTFELPRPEMLGSAAGLVLVLLGLGVVAFLRKKVNLSPLAWLVAAAVLGGALYVLFVVSPTVSIATAACLFLFLGCTGKSAQIPLFVWLPDAMAGPTPVSALIHAATMVTAGVYLCCRLSPVFMQSPTALMIISVVGALTALLAATIALVQNHMKRILAYSTVSQLGFMFAAVGAGAFTAGFFHVFTHAFFKACLFLGAGAVMHAVHAHGDADVRLLGGMRKHLPVVRWTFLLSCLAIAGFPLTSGFFSKDEILLGVVNAQGIEGYSPEVSWFVFGVLVLAATMTAFYMFRLYFLTFAGEYRSAKAHGSDEAGHDDHGHGEHGYAEHPHPPEPAIAWPLRILGVGAILAGLVNIEPILHVLHIHPEGEWGNWWGHWLGPVVASAGEGLENGWIYAAIGGTAAMAVGIGLAYSMYGSGTRMPAENPGAFHQLLLNKWKVDELYEAVVVWPMRWVAEFAAAVDKYFVDMILAKATATAVEIGGFLFTRVQNGVVYAYGTVMALGVLGVGAWFFLPHPALTVEKLEGETASLRAAVGLGYAYRWDGDGDGEFDSEEFEGSNTLERTYAAGERKAFVARLGGTLVGAVGGADVDITLPTDGSAVTLRDSELGALWAKSSADGSAPVPPVLRVDGDEVVVRPNDALSGRDGNEFRLKYGESAQLGNRTLRVGALVRSSVEVQNAFGVVRRQSKDSVIFPAEAEHAEARHATVGGAL